MLGYLDLQMLRGLLMLTITKRANTITGYRVQLRYILDQKYAIDMLTHISTLFEHGKVIVRSTDMYRYYCDSFIGLGKVCSYF